MYPSFPDVLPIAADPGTSALKLANFYGLARKVIKKDKFVH